MTGSRGWLTRDGIFASHTRNRYQRDHSRQCQHRRRRIWQKYRHQYHWLRNARRMPSQLISHLRHVQPHDESGRCTVGHELIWWESPTQ